MGVGVLLNALICDERSLVQQYTATGIFLDTKCEQNRASLHTDSIEKISISTDSIEKISIYFQIVTFSTSF